MNCQINKFCYGKGVPDDLIRNNNGTFTLTQPTILPRVADAVAAYEGQGGHLTCLSHIELTFLPTIQAFNRKKMMQFQLTFSRFDTIFHHLVNDDNRLFKERTFHLMLSFDINIYIIISCKQRQFLRVISLRLKRFFFSFSCKLTQLMRVLLQITIMLFTNKRL